MSRVFTSNTNSLQTWVVVADSSRARYFTLAKDRSLHEFESMVSPEHRLHEGDLTSDRSGRTFDSNGPGRHAMVPPHTTMHQATVNFAKRLADRIEQARVAGEIERLILIAPPKFLGHLRAGLSDGATKLVVLSIAKELTTTPPLQLKKQIPRFIPQS